MGSRCCIDVGVIISCPEKVFLGDDVWIDNYVMLTAGPPFPGARATRTIDNHAYRGEVGEIHIGDRTHVAPYSMIQGHGGVAVGRDVTIGAHVAMYSYSHHYSFPNDEPVPDAKNYASVPKYSGLAPDSEQSMISGAVTLDDATAVLANSVVLPGSRVGRYSIIGAASLVSGTVAPGVIAAGNPLTLRKQRFRDGMGLE